VALIFLLVSCTGYRATYQIDEAGMPILSLEQYNLLRVATVSQVATYDPETQMVAITQVGADDAMSGNLMNAWSRLMDVAGYALAGAGISAAAGGPTTPAAIGGALIGYAKSKLMEPDPESEPPAPEPEDEP
jgi:hypothetical protein